MAIKSYALCTKATIHHRLGGADSHEGSEENPVIFECDEMGFVVKTEKYYRAYLNLNTILKIELDHSSPLAAA